jgi:Na+/melibiose symporter-like transporter
VNPNANLSLGQVLAYGATGLPLAIMGIPLYVYLPPFYAQQLGLGLGAVGLALMISRLWDVILDPIVGFYADLIPGRHRRKTLMLIGLPLFLLATYFLLNPPPQVGIAYLYLWAMLGFLAWTLITIPYTSFGAEADPTPQGRTRLSASREGFGLIGVILAASLPVFLTSHTSGETQAANGDLLSVVFWLMAILLPIGLVLLFAAVPEKPARRRPIKLSAGWPLLRDNRQLRGTLVGFFLNNLANGIPATLFILFINDRLAAPQALGPLLLLYFGAGIVALPFWTWVAHRYGKRSAWGFSITLAGFSFLAVPFLYSGDVTAFAVVCLISGFSLGADMALPASIQGDLAGADADAGGGDRAGLFFGLFGLVTKLALAIAVGLGYGLLSLAGYQSGDSHTDALAWVYGGLPVLFKLAAALIVFRYLHDTESLVISSTKIKEVSP